jgi:hypothetical protein
VAEHEFGEQEVDWTPNDGTQLRIRGDGRQSLEDVDLDLVEIAVAEVRDVATELHVGTETGDE